MLSAAAVPRAGIRHLLAQVLASLLTVVAASGAPSRDPAPQSPARPLPSAAHTLEGVVDPAGRPRDPFSGTNDVAVVLVFINIDCPVSNRYAPEIQRLEARYAAQRIKFWLIQTDATESPSRTRKHLEEFGYDIDLLRDTRGELVRLAKAVVTPEAAVFDRQGRRVYHGRIDNRFADFGKPRPKPTQTELQDALESILTGRPVAVAHAPAVGCAITPMNR